MRFEGRWFRVAFQLRQRPGSYSIGQQTVGATAPIDECISNSQLEYYTRNRGVHKLTRLLVRVMPKGFGWTKIAAKFDPAAGEVDAKQLTKDLVAAGMHVAEVFAKDVAEKINSKS